MFLLLFSLHLFLLSVGLSSRPISMNIPSQSAASPGRMLLPTPWSKMEMLESSASEKHWMEWHKVFPEGVFSSILHMTDSFLLLQRVLRSVQISPDNFCVHQIHPEYFSLINTLWLSSPEFIFPYGSDMLLKARSQQVYLSAWAPRVFSPSMNLQSISAWDAYHLSPPRLLRETLKQQLTPLPHPAILQISKLRLKERKSLPRVPWDWGRATRIAESILPASASMPCNAVYFYTTWNTTVPDTPGISEYMRWEESQSCPYPTISILLNQPYWRFTVYLLLLCNELLSFVLIFKVFREAAFCLVQGHFYSVSDRRPC